MGAALALALAFLLWPAFDLVGEGRVLRWHVGQPGFVQGGLELLLLFGLLAGLLWRRGRCSAWVAVVVAWLYLRRHHVDLPLLMALLHLELLLALGAGLLRLGGEPPGRGLAALDRPLFVGVIAWILLVLGVSLAGWGRPADLKLLAIALLLPAFWLGRSTPAVARAWRALDRQRGGARLLGVALLVLFLGWLARSNSLDGYDALWYGLRPQQVLAPAHSFFDHTGLVSPVYYFPKLYELLIAPLSSFRDHSYPLAFGVLVLAALAVVTWRFARSLGIGQRLALAGALVVVTVPAIANTAVSPKPDVFAALLVLMGGLWGWQGVRRRLGGGIAWMLAAFGLATAAKLGTPPFALALGIGVLLAAWLLRRRARWQAPPRSAWIVLGAAAVATLGLHARTWWLTGMPTVGPDALVALWQQLGFAWREPAGTLDWVKPQDWRDVPTLVRDLLFAPSVLSHIVVTWTGNIWLWLGLVGIALTPFAQPRGRRFPPASRVVAALLTPTLLAGLMLALGVGHIVRGGDGNYLIVAIVVAVLAGLHAVARATRPLRGAQALVLGVLAATAAGQYAYSFACANWNEPGTRPFDLDFTRSTFDTGTTVRARLASAGLADVAQALHELGGRSHLVGYVEPGELGYQLPARFEHLATISYSRPSYVADADTFRHFLSVACVDALILPRDAGQAAHLHPGPLALLPALRADPTVVRREFQRYELWYRPAPPGCR